MAHNGGKSRKEEVEQEQKGLSVQLTCVQMAFSALTQSGILCIQNGTTHSGLDLLVSANISIQDNSPQTYPQGNLI